MNRKQIGEVKILARMVFYRTEEEVSFSFWYFIFFVLLQTTVLMSLVYALCYLARPDLFWVQLGSSWYLYLLYFAAIHLGLSLFEFLFHRYVLHRVFWSRLAIFKSKHTDHHSVTHVRLLQNTVDQLGRIRIRNKYPITKPDQIESSAFPAYALIAFSGLFSFLIVPLQLVLPDLPILTVGYLAVVFSFSLYEVIHAMEHLDYNRHWKGWVERSSFVRKIYGFHLMHHWFDKVNQAIAGFFGFPIWDWIFGTYFVPKALPLPGIETVEVILLPPSPIRLIIWIDQRVQGCEDRYIERQKKAAFLGRNRNED
ncbi:MAG: hypothetical protein AAB565_00830 [Patescibacteria group bacterium]